MTTHPTTPTATDLAREIIEDCIALDMGLDDTDEPDKAGAILAALAAQGVTLAGPGHCVVDTDAVNWATRAVRMCRDSVSEEESWLIWHTVYEKLRAALSGTTDDQPADRARPTEDE